MCLMAVTNILINIIITEARNQVKPRRTPADEARRRSTVALRISLVVSGVVEWI